MLDHEMDGGLASFGLAQPGADEIRRVALNRVVPFQQLDVPLASVLTTNTSYPIAGNFLMFSFDDVGAVLASHPFPTQIFRVVLLGADGQPGARLPVTHGTIIRAPFFGIALESNSTIGGGAFVRIAYGTNVDMVAPLRQIQVGPGNLALRTLVQGTAHRGVSEFRSNAALAANTPESIISAATNTSGIFVQFATLYGPGQPYGLTYGTVAPAAALDNNPLLMLDAAAAAVVTTPHPRTIVSGNRLDRISSSALTSSHLVHVAYSLTQSTWQFP